MADIEVPLAGGNLNTVVRLGDTVRREAGPWTAAVHGLLAYLAEGGYPAPVPLGFDDQGREILTYIVGTAVHPDHLDFVASLAGLQRAAELIADYHDVKPGFVPSSDPAWRDDARDLSDSEEVLAHNDLTPWNPSLGLYGPTSIGIWLRRDAATGTWHGRCTPLLDPGRSRRRLPPSRLSASPPSATGHVSPAAIDRRDAFLRAAVDELV